MTPILTDPGSWHLADPSIGLDVWTISCLAAQIERGMWGEA